MMTGQGNKPIRTLDLATGRKEAFLPGTDPAIDGAGNLYVMGGYGSNAMFRYDPAGKPLPFAATGTYKLETGPWTAYGPDIGLRGHCVAPDGAIYLLRSNNKWGGGVGNVYLGINVKPKDRPLPPAFVGKVPDQAWDYWRFDRQGPRDVPWAYPYENPYLTHMGSVMKFGPAGGAIYGLAVPPQAPRGQPAPPAPALSDVANAPAGAPTYWSGYLKKEAKVAGAAWRYAGVGPIPAADFNWGDPGCICWNSRLAADPFGRVYAPNVFRFGVEMLDANGNLIARIGGYGNTDDGVRGKGSGRGETSPTPRLAFAWPAYVDAAGERVFVSDPSNRQITVVRFDWQAETSAVIE
jgi:hypothetical protein